MAEQALQQRVAVRPETEPEGVRIAGPRQGRLLQLAALLNGRAENRTGLPDGLKAGVEALSGLSMDHVRVHRNSSKPAQLRAHAYAQGNDIHLGPGQERHLPHEAWHVVQQMQGRVRPTLQLRGRDVNDSAALESEADKMGVRARQVRAPSPQTLRQASAGDGPAQAVVQCLAEPGVGIEMESSTIKLQSKAWPSDDPERLGGHELKGQSIYPNEAIKQFDETTMWSLTAESPLRKLAVEIIVHGDGDRKGVKLNNNNVGILAKIAANIQRHMEYWQDWVVTPALGGRHWEILGHQNIRDSIWGLQATSAVPLQAMHRLLHDGNVHTDDGAPTALIEPARMPAIVHITPEDVADAEVPQELVGDPALLAVLSLVASYARGAAAMTPAHPGVKHLIPVMPRTNFIGMLNTLPKHEMLFAHGGKNLKSLAYVALKKAGSEPGAVFYWKKNIGSYEEWRAKQPPGKSPSQYSREYTDLKEVGMTVKEWIEQLAGGRDLMAENDRENRHGQIGGIGETVEHALNDIALPAPVFEFRDMGSVTLADAPAKFGEIERAVRHLLTVPVHE